MSLEFVQKMVAYFDVSCSSTCSSESSIETSIISVFSELMSVNQQSQAQITTSQVQSQTSLSLGDIVPLLSQASQGNQESQANNKPYKPQAQLKPASMPISQMPPLPQPQLPPHPNYHINNYYPPHLHRFVLGLLKSVRKIKKNFRKKK